MGMNIVDIRCVRLCLFKYNYNVVFYVDLGSKYRLFLLLVFFLIIWLIFVVIIVRVMLKVFKLLLYLVVKLNMELLVNKKSVLLFKL